MQIELTEETKVGIIIGAIGVLVLMLICMICKLAKNAQNKKNSSKNKPEPTWWREGRYSEESACSLCVKERKELTKEELQLYEMRGRHSERATYGVFNIVRGKINLSLRYEKDMKHLVLCLIEASNLRPKDFWDLSDTYVKGRLEPSLERTHKFKTELYRRSSEPRYDEQVVFAVPAEALRGMSLFLSVWEVDKYSRHYIIGELEIQLKDVNLTEGETMWRELKTLQKPDADLGEILYSLSYLPTAERLTIVCMKAKNLNFVLSDWKNQARIINPFIKVVLLFDGKRVKKKKTSVRKQEPSPVFNESMTFDIPAHLLHRIVFVISVADRNFETGRSEVLGRVIIGSGTSGEELRHWNEMIASPRKPIAAWHKLRM